jgi:hypothetical protein
MTFALMLAMPAVALADLVTVSDADTLQVSGDTTKQVGQTGSARTHLLVNDNATDDVNGCNANTTNKVKVTFDSTAKDKDGNTLATSPVTFNSPGYVELEDCDNAGTTGTIEGAKTLGYTVGSSAQVGDVITVTAAASGGRQGGIGDYSYDTFKITVVAPPEQGTSLSVSPASGTYGGTTSLSATLNANGSGVANKSVDFTLNGQNVGSANTNSSGVATLSNVSLSGIDAGTYADAVSASYAGTGSGCTTNCYGPSEGKASLTVDAKQITGSFTADDKVYDGGTSATILTRSLTGKVGADDVSLAGGTATFADKNVGTGKTVTGTGFSLSGTDKDNYTLASSTLTTTANISARPITVTADAKSKEYGNADPSLTYNVTDGSLVNASDLTGSLTRVAGENVGTYAINKGSLSAGSNYELTFVGANLTITERPIEVTAAAKSKTYGDADPNLTYSITSGNLVGSDALSGSLARDPGENVGTYAINKGTLSAGSNYELTFVGANLTINPATLTVNANNATTVYGNSPTLTPDISGFKFGENANTAAGWLGAASCSLTSAAGTDVGSYPNAIECTKGNLAATNYVFVNGTIKGTLTITQRPITVTAAAKSKTYGDNDPALTYSITSGNLVVNDSLSGSLARDPGENVGTYAINKGTLTAGGNYSITYVGANLTINARPINVTADAKSKLFGDPDPALTYQVSGGPLVGNDSFTGALSRDPGEAVGQYNILLGTVKVSDGNNGNNYAINYTGAKLTIGAWTLKGFYQPVDMDTATTTALNTVKNGSTVPFKFNAYKGATELTDNTNNAVVKSFTQRQVVCPNGTGVTADPIEVTTTGATSLRYDATAGQWVQNWQTPKKQGVCYDVTLTTQDGSTLLAHFQLK